MFASAILVWPNRPLQPSPLRSKPILTRPICGSILPPFGIFRAMKQALSSIWPEPNPMRLNRNFYMQFNDFADLGRYRGNSALIPGDMGMHAIPAKQEGRR